MSASGTAETTGNLSYQSYDNFPGAGMLFHTADDEETSRLEQKKSNVRKAGKKRTGDRQKESFLMFTPATPRQPAVVQYKKRISNNFRAFFHAVEEPLGIDGAIIIDGFEPDSVPPHQNDADGDEIGHAIDWTESEFFRMNDDDGQFSHLKCVKVKFENGPLDLFRSARACFCENPPFYAQDILAAGQDDEVGTKVDFQVDNDSTREVPRSFFRSITTYTLADIGENLLDLIPCRATGINEDRFHLGGCLSSLSTRKDVLATLDFHVGGQPTRWIVIAATFERQVENLLKKLSKGRGSGRCRQWVRHENIILTPEILDKAGIPFKDFYQLPGQLLIIASNSYYQSMSLGEDYHIARKYFPITSVETRQFVEKDVFECQVEGCPENLFDLSSLKYTGSKSLKAKRGTLPYIELVTDKSHPPGAPQSMFNPAAVDTCFCPQEMPTSMS